MAINLKGLKEAGLSVHPIHQWLIDLIPRADRTPHAADFAEEARAVGLADPSSPLALDHERILADSLTFRQMLGR